MRRPNSLDPALRLLGIEQAAARVIDGMDLQDDLVEIPGEPLEFRRIHPGRQAVIERAMRRASRDLSSARKRA